MLKSDLEIRKIILDKGNEGIFPNALTTGRYEFYPYPGRLMRLSEELRTYILRERGDIDLYLDLQQQVFDLSPSHATNFDKGLFDIISWLKKEMNTIHTATAEPNTLVISFLAFGKEYVQKLLDYNFKSLMAYENIPCLTLEKKVIFYIQTDEEGKKLIEHSCVAMKACGVKFEFVVLPENVLKHLKNPDIIYWLLGASASLSLHFAKSQHAAFHHSYPDIIYSDRFFSELLRLSKTHKAILGSGMRSDYSKMAPLLEPYFKTKGKAAQSISDGKATHHADNLSIPSSDLLSHHMNALHPAAWGLVVNNRPAYWLFPEAHLMIWESEEMIHINSPHVMAHWLDNSIIKDLPVRYYQTLDSEMDLIIKGDFYVVQENDQVYQEELSPPDRQSMMDIYCEARQTANMIWSCVSYRNTFKFFVKEMRLKLNRSIRPKPYNVIPAKHVEVLQRHLYNTCLSCDPYAGVKVNSERSHIGWIFE